MLETNRKGLIIGTSVAAVVLIGGSAAAGYFLAKKSNPVSPTAPTNELPGTPPLTATPNNSATSTGQFATRIVTAITLPADFYKGIIWGTRTEISVLPSWFGKSSSNVDGVKTEYDYGAGAKYYQVGTINYGGKIGRVILLQVPPEGPGDNVWYRFVEYDNKIIMLGNYSGYKYQYNDPQQSTGSEDETWNPVLAGRLAVDNTLTIPLLDFPERLVGPSTRQAVVRQQSLAFAAPAEVDPKDKIVFTDAQYGPIRQADRTGGFYLTSPDGSAINYALQPDFISKDGVLSVNWSDGKVRTSTYVYIDVGGCGGSNYASVVNPSDISTEQGLMFEKDLTGVAKTGFGDWLYELKDPNHQMLKDLYDSGLWAVTNGDGSVSKISYTDFIATKPLLFWVDPFGRLIKLRANKFLPAAECGKPVIYLYPEKTTRVQVNVAPQGGLTYSDPAYGNGWHVIADPNGSLTEVSSGKTYPYLFWEGRGGLYQTPKRGFVVAKAEVETTLREKLGILGLNAKETADFLEFWLPRMQAKPYYFITFLGTSQMNVLAPLTISPRPDTVFRILMDFTPLDAPITVETLPLGKTPERKGFTVVEWGGVIR